MFKSDLDKPETRGTVAAAAPQGEEDLQAGDPIGAFTGYLRRAKSSAQGLTAQFFGENGNDADVIAAMHLTRYKDMVVKVTVWMLKNSDGKIMGKEGDFPVLAEFIAKLKNPRPSDSGQTAQFFGENGPNSDAVNALNQSNVQDALVYVEIVKADLGQIASDLGVVTPGPVLDSESTRMTPREAQELKKQQRKAGEGWRALQVAAFFRNTALWGALGGERSYAEWLTSQPCCQPGAQPCPNTPALPYRVPTLRNMPFVPLCEEHCGVWNRGEGQAGAQAPLAFLSSKQITLVQQWAEYRLRQVMGVPPGHDPLPSKIYGWAVDNNLRNSIPASFIGLT
jgi:hypothetical protein